MTDAVENPDKLSSMEIDVIGEVMNISMGTAATAMSTILNTKVNITTPRIETIGVEEFEFSYLEPVVGVLINYVEGIEGANVLLLQESDMKKILSQLFDMDTSDDIEFDEISKSAIGEIMNQMMGAAAGALASFLGKVVNISPPILLDTTNKSSIRDLFSLKGDNLVSIKFNLSIEGLVESEFISAMEPTLAREIVSMSMGASGMGDEEEEVAPPPPPPVQQAPVQPETAYQPPPPQAEPARVVRNDPPPAAYAPPQQPVQVNPYEYRQLGVDPTINIPGDNLDLLMSVPIQITVELGKTRKKIKDIAELTLGNIVELDRQAGDQVDVIANGRLIARGDVVVVDDNYSVKITEIIKVRDNSEQKK
ncbi:flagellar motor switch phosphatase FliY [Acetobacterium sp.]|jgi:flagellar motor switch protein FliN/FliY|uniref:flagellar motor switch phosphatase FliY n=1 Tax=Acetobacterium sp. TaxID=1872094 RepID=UPI000CAA2154|nr:flagellar motor switch phosphatase FliY [Acetobacterium sp.]MDO9493792.1 flagellar motor switch phosphatase FliY [Acetobacterium sp.]PKM74593.1 MAG: flagellar motor switch phosphatase FliY [Firmicutes bacterium HGW-Firmicutes-17]